eukprot:GGOE01063099.1.p1 GENE.GGOE01063099.1~~GGOE01063099.1.p1  ORF type:complete len:593 (-),score=229.25 GGOE01063099.1:428-2152(-)
MAGTKLADIMRYLDEVETADDVCSVAASFDGTRSGSMLAETVVSGLRCTITTLKRDLAEKDQQAAAFRKKMQDAKAREAARLEQAQRDFQAQKEELEGVVARNLQFIDTLLADKEALNTKVAGLSTELKQLADKHDKKIAQLEEQQAGMATAQKSQWANTEKRRRAAWQEEQTQKIKAETLKALEPDIAQLMNRHRAEKQRLENERIEEVRRHEAALTQKERELVELRRWLEEVRAQELANKDGLLEQRERDLVAQRTRLAREYEQSLLREREFFQQQTREQGDRFERQLDELRGLLREAKEREAEARQGLQQELGAEKAKLRAEKTAQMADFEQRLRERLELDLQARRQQMKDELATEAAAEATRLRKQLEEERDAAIELVIRRLEDDAVGAKKAAAASEKAWQEKHARVLREKEALSAAAEELREQLAVATAALEEKQRQAETSATALRQAAEEHEGKMRELQTRLMLKVQQTDDIWSTKYATRVQDQTAVIDQQAARICALQREAERLAAQSQERDETNRRQHDRELEQLQGRVQQALAKKDATIQELQALLLKAEERNRQVEDVLLAQSA